MADQIPVRPPLPTEPLECRQMAEDPDRPEPERLRWALLAIAGELHTIRRNLPRPRK